MLVPHIAYDDCGVIGWDGPLKAGNRPLTRVLEWMYPGPQFDVHLDNRSRCR